MKKDLTSLSPDQRAPSTAEYIGTSETDAPLGRVSTGDRHADEILGGGFPANSINIVTSVSSGC